MSNLSYISTFVNQNTNDLVWTSEIREMEYTPGRHEPEVLNRGFYRGYGYLCLSFGVHPCAYVAVEKGQPYYDATEYEEVVDIDCHGGCTYVEKGRGDYFDEYYTVIGWDYAHTGDFEGYYYLGSGSPLPRVHDQMKKWTTEEIVSECFKVIDSLCLLESSQLFYK